MLPRNLRTAPDVPETTLAYITDDEKALLGLLKPGTPHKGPEGVPSYDSLDYVAAPSKPKLAPLIGLTALPPTISKLS